MRKQLASALTVIALLQGCASVPGPIKISPDTYMITREDHRGIFGSLASLKAEVINEANGFAARQGKVAIPISSQEKPLGRGPAQWASFEYQFRVVDNDDPEVQRTALLPRADVVIEKNEKRVIENGPAPTLPAPSVAAQTAEVSITSSVENADVYVDGNFVGNAPLPNYRLPAGTHKIEVRAQGFESWSRELTVAANATSRVVAQLQKLP
jgi:PEGA domain